MFERETRALVTIHALFFIRRRMQSCINGVGFHRRWGHRMREVRLKDLTFLLSIFMTAIFQIARRDLCAGLQGRVAT